MTTRDKLLMGFLKTINLNPERKDKVVRKLKFLGKLGVYRRSCGYKKSIYHTETSRIEIYKSKKNDNGKIVLFAHGGVFIMGLSSIYRNMHRFIITYPLKCRYFGG